MLWAVQTNVSPAAYRRTAIATFTFTVDVVLTGYVYDPELSEETSDNVVEP